MSAAKWILNLWPGLPQLWWRGTWQSMSVAVAFAALLNSALLTTYVEGFALPAYLVVAQWMCVITSMLAACVMRLFDASEVVTREEARQRQTTFQQAQTAYLKGHWFEAERHVRELLGIDSHDAEARLLLVSILRRSGRTAEASKQLTRLAKSVQSFSWQLEMEQEMQRLAHAESTLPADAELPQHEDTAPTSVAFPGKAA